MESEMKYLAAVALTFTIIASPVSAADECNSDNCDLELGDMLGSETACGLTYDQDAIQNFIVKHVDPNDMGFAPSLLSLTAGTKALIGEMSASSLTAHCTQIRRVAKHYGFIK
jgi:hypothetical protein